MATPVGAGGGSWSIMTSTGLLPCQPKILDNTSTLVLVAGGTSNGPAGGGGGSQGGGAGGVNTLNTVLSDMQLADEDRPHGVPDFYSWAFGPSVGVSTPTNPLCTAGTYGGQIYFGSAGPGGDTNTRVQLRMIEMYVYSVSQAAWLVMMQANGQNNGNGINGAQYIEDYFQNESVPANIRDESANGGGISVLMTKQTRAAGPTPNGASHYNFEFFGNSRGSIPVAASDVGAAFTTMQARLILDNPHGTDDRSLANYVVNQEFDWWVNLTIGFDQGQNNPGGAQGRFRKVPTDGAWIACNAWNGPRGFTPTWQNGSTYGTGITLATMQAHPVPLNAMGS